MVLNGAATTPEAEACVVSHMAVSNSNHPALAAAFGEYLETLSQESHSFMVVAPSREDPQTIIAFTGFRSIQALMDAEKVGSSVKRGRLTDMGDVESGPSQAQS